jgi:putative ABC transport system permease protein
MKVSLLKLAIANANRNRARTFLTAGMVVASTALFIISLSWLDGIWNTILEASTDAGGHVRVVTKQYSERESLHPLDENIEEMSELLELLRSQRDVKAVFPVIQSGATVSAGDEIGDVFGSVIGAPSDYFTRYWDVDAKQVEGRWFAENRGELVIGKKLADLAHAHVGDEIVALGQTQDGSLSPIKGKLVGIVRSGGPMIDRSVFVELKTMQWMVDIPQGATKLVIYGDDYRNAQDLHAQLNLLPQLQAYDLRAWQNLAPWDSQLPMMNGVKYMLIVVVVFLAALGVWNTMMMSVLERTTEIGVLRAMGMTRFGAVVLFVVEASTIALIGGAVGVLAGALATLYMEGIGIRIPEKLMAQIEIPFNDTMYAQLNMETLVMAYCTALITAFLGSLLPSIRAASIAPVVAMRSNR